MGLVSPEVASAVIMLATISYMLGVSIMNTPNRRIRNLGLNLVYDGGTIIVFLALLSAIPLLMNLALSLITGTQANSTTLENQYTTFNCWLMGKSLSSCPPQPDLEGINQIYDTLNKALGLMSLWPVIGQASIDIWWSYFQPALTLITTIKATQTLLFFAGTFIRVAWLPFVAIGALLYGLPAKMGRGAGAAMIGTLLVFYVGLPFMPMFVDSILCIGAPDLCTIKTEQLGPFSQTVDNLNKQLFQPTQDFIQLQKHPNLQFQVYDWYDKPIGPDILILQGTDGQDNWFWTRTNGTLIQGLPQGTYTISQVWYLNASLPWEGPRTVYAPDPYTEDITRTNIKLHIVPFYLTSLINCKTHCTFAKVGAFLDVGSWQNANLDTSWGNYPLVDYIGPGSDADTNHVTFRVNGPFNNITSAIIRVFLIDQSAQFKLDGKTVQAMGAPDGNLGNMYTLTIGPYPGWSGNCPSGYCPCDLYSCTNNPHIVEITVQSKPPPNYNGGNIIPYITNLFNNIYDSMNQLVLQSQIINSVSIAFLMRRLVGPLIYLIILAVAASDVTSLLGGKSLPLPGL